MKRYLSVAHRDNVDGCGYPAVASEIASAPGEVRLAFAEAIEKRVAAALATMALTIGGLLLLRATQGHPMSEETISARRSWALPETADLTDDLRKLEMDQVWLLVEYLKVLRTSRK